MKVTRVLLGACLLASVLAVPALSKDVVQEPKLPDPVVKLQELAGRWKGTAQLFRPDKPLVSFKVLWRCEKEAGGWAISCTGNAETVGEEVPTLYQQMDLMGVDIISGDTSWFTVTNRGEAHNHTVEWTDPQTLKARTSWQNGGKQYEEEITLAIVRKGAISFRAVVTVEGERLAEFSGNVER